MLQGRLDQDKGAKYIDLCDRFGCVDRPVDMCFCCQVHDGIEAISFGQSRTSPASPMSLSMNRYRPGASSSCRDEVELG